MALLVQKLIHPNKNFTRPGLFPQFRHSCQKLFNFIVLFLFLDGLHSQTLIFMPNVLRFSFTFCVSCKKNAFFRLLFESKALKLAIPDKINRMQGQFLRCKHSSQKFCLFTAIFVSSFKSAFCGIFASNHVRSPYLDIN